MPNVQNPAVNALVDKFSAYTVAQWDEEMRSWPNLVKATLLALGMLSYADRMKNLSIPTSFVYRLNKQVADTGTEHAQIVAALLHLGDTHIGNAVAVLNSTWVG